MKASLATSVALHVALLAYGLLTFSGPRPFDVADMESLPVDIVPVEELTQIQEGDKAAPIKETPAPKPTKKPQTVPDAQKVGENERDLETPPTPDARPKEVKAAAAAPAAPEPPTPKPPEPEAKPEPKPPEPKPPKPKPVAKEPPPEPAPQEEAKPEPKPEADVAEATEADMALPDSAPAPAARPEPPEPMKTASVTKTPEKKAEETPKKVAEKQKSEDKEFDADQVTALLNKEKASGGGAKRSTQEAALGGKTKTGAKLSQGEMDALSSQLSGCWSIPAGTEDGGGLRVSVRFNLDASGRLDGRPAVEASSGNRSFDESAVRAVQKCDREGLTLPKDKADTWAEVVVNFDPAEMF